ncbi:MAG: mobilization protein [Gammaproteobacteria bacterium]|nr:mobilization protein [Gammaproteobacteria bacterium]MBL6998536.1 mobilization protein [Gammaproteobacteria bacterium]
MGRVHFIGGEKGGVGKSLTSRLLAQYLIDHASPFAGFDLDQSHATFSRFYDEYTGQLVVDDFSSLDRILEFADQNPQHDIIVDLAAQTSQRLNKWIDDSDVMGAFAELGYQVFLWHVMDDGRDSINLLEKLLNSYTQSSLRFVVVENLGRGDNFEGFLRSQTFRKAQSRNADFVTLDKLETRLTQKIDFNNLSFWAAANDRQLIGFVERKRMKVWLDNNYQQLDAFLAAPAKVTAK